MRRVESGIDFRPARPLLAPLQRVTLADSLADPAAGHHVEQLEIRFAAGVAAERVVSAWEDTVVRTEALRIAFVITGGMARTYEIQNPANFLILDEPAPLSWESWLQADRCRSLIAPHQVPWRAVYWPDERRFLWTFHHALLDGRSIARVAGAFLERVGGGAGADLALSQWREPSREAVAVAERNFREMGPVHHPPFDPPQREGRAVCRLGADSADLLESRATVREVTAATLLIWAWGQALAENLGTESVVVEQLRAGAPQAGTAGFVMNTLPLKIQSYENEAEGIRDLRARLLALREMETVSAEDFPRGTYPDLDGPTSSVIMVERHTLNEQLGCAAVESLVLHEAKGETLMATAYLRPDLRLEVEGPGRHELLAAWVGKLDREIHPA